MRKESSAVEEEHVNVRRGGDPVVTSVAEGNLSSNATLASGLVIEEGVSDVTADVAFEAV
jgi:hypothetical protein